MKEKIKELLQREFNYEETLQVLKSPIQIYWCWGVERLFHVEEVGLILKVNGFKWQQLVLITLAWDDTYIVTLLDLEFNPITTKKGIYFDMLQMTVDNLIETD